MMNVVAQSPAPSTSNGKKRRNGIAPDPARNGAIARTMPTKRPMKIALPPCCSKNASTFSSRSGVIWKRGPWRTRKSRPRRLPR